MLIERIIEFSDKIYSAKRTEFCDYKKRKIKLPAYDTCKDCFKSFHYSYEDSLKEYSCENMPYFYSCSYLYKYTSEIFYLLERLQGESESFRELKFYRVMSVGCGACPDLMAFEYFRNKLGCSKDLGYYGIDKNELWKKIHKEILDYGNSTGKFLSKFLYSDAIERFKDESVSDANILILQYVISHFYNTDTKDRINVLIETLIDKVVRYKNKDHSLFVIINDINNGKRGKSEFTVFVERLKEKGYEVLNEYNYYFNKEDLYNFQKNGLPHNDCSIKNFFPISSNLELYNPWRYCTSSQLVIEVK